MTDGLIICSRYAFAPNYFHYCGPERQGDLLGYIQEVEADRGLAEILNRFETLYPYLRLIAAENHIKNPFDPRVVEAYWLGNGLLAAVTTKVLASHLSDTLGIKRKTTKNQFSRVMDHVANEGMPQHTAHVLTIFVRTGHLAIPHTLTTLDSCRISWGKIMEKMPAAKSGVGWQYMIKTRPLVYEKNMLLLGQPVIKTVTDIGVGPKPGSWVSVHWGFICGVLTLRQRRNLAFYTQRAIGAANQQRIQEYTGI